MKNLFKLVSGGNFAKFINHETPEAVEEEVKTEASPAFAEVMNGFDTAFTDAKNSEMRVGRKAKALYAKIVELYETAGVNVSENKDMAKWLKDSAKRYVKDVKKAGEIANRQKDAVLNYMKNHDNYKEVGTEKEEVVVEKNKELDIKVKVEETEEINPKLSLKEANDKVLSGLTGKRLNYAKKSLSVDFSKLGIGGENVIDENGKSSLTEEFQMKLGIDMDGLHGKETEAMVEKVLGAIEEEGDIDKAIVIVKNEKRLIKENNLKLDLRNDFSDKMDKMIPLLAGDLQEGLKMIKENTLNLKGDAFEGSRKGVLKDMKERIDEMRKSKKDFSDKIDELIPLLNEDLREGTEQMKEAILQNFTEESAKNLIVQTKKAKENGHF